jgi:molybdate transport repressor ModE-like protein
MQIKFSLQWRGEGHPAVEIEEQLFILLQAIRANGSLAEAARVNRMSYRHAWGLLGRQATLFGSPLALLERGRGAALTALGEKLLEEKRHVDDEAMAHLERWAAGINGTISGLVTTINKPVLRIHASHGLAIGQLIELLRKDKRFTTEFQTQGSLDNLKSLNDKRCQVAGFHIPLQLVHRSLAPRYRYWISPQRHLLMLVATREQGLMVRRGNPRKIKRLADLTKRSVRFINRQRNSGTRTILDQLLLQEKVPASRINGYSNEEFTHLAVAAMVASGAADAGFGIRAAAAQFDLDFIPFLHEAYILAIDNGLEPFILKTLEQALRSRSLRRKINRLPGYHAINAGKYYTFNQLFEQAME